jgi:hypothetical protein
MVNDRKTPGVDWKTYVDSQNAAAQRERDLIRQFNEAAQQRLQETTDRRFDTLAEWRESLADTIAGMPTRPEVAAQIQNIGTLVSTLNGRISDFMQDQSIKSGTYLTQEQFQATEKARAADVKDSRRALLAALVGIGIALIGWVITIVLTVVTHAGS